MDAPAVRPGVHAALRGRDRGPRRLPQPHPLVRAERAADAGPGRLLLDGVRHPRVARHLLGRPRRPRRRPLQGGERPRRAPRGRGPPLPLRLLPPDGRPRRLPAAHVPRLRLRPPAGAPGAGPGRRRPHRPRRPPRPRRPRGGVEGAGRPRAGADARHRHPAERPGRPPDHRCSLRARPRDEAVPGDRARHRRRPRPAGPRHPPVGVAHERGPRRVPRPRAGARAGAPRRQPQRGPRRGEAHDRLHDPHPGARRQRDLRQEPRPQVPRPVDPSAATTAPST